MTRSLAAVRFPDETVKWCLYNGTADILIPRLFDSPDDPWDAYDGFRNGDTDISDLYPGPVGDIEQVALFVEYGGNSRGQQHTRLAARNIVLGDLSDLVFTGESVSVPNWYRRAQQQAIR